MASKKSNHNRSKQLNPQHPTYWKSCGQARPSNFADVSAYTQQRGLREAQICAASHESRAEQALLAEDRNKARELLQVVCPKAPVMLGGSRHKKTHLRGADQDTKVLQQQAKTQEQHEKITQLLPEYGFRDLDPSNPRIHKIKRKGPPMDVVFQNTNQRFFTSGRPKNPCSHNPELQKAVREVKLSARERGVALRGHDIQQCCIEQQQTKKHQDFLEVAEGAKSRLMA
ncbi:unnamed protein product [Durusdinium trenchii]|uniref:Ribosome biogenesis protein NOP53 n=2 Tax=Durusdinium trenchii TaxID=1381693 RepID=A0ABP0JVQ9_9DINO